MNNNSFSIITCVKSDTSELIETWNSISDKISPIVHWVIKYSQHCSKKFIDQIPDHPSIIKIVSGDESLYGALNQALLGCKSKFYMVIGAGDKIVESFDRIDLIIKENPNKDAYFFATKISKDGQQRILVPNPDELNVRMSCPHPSAILKTEISKKINGFSEKYEIASDYDHLCRYKLISDLDLFYSSLVLVDFLGGGISDTRPFEGYLEEELIRSRVYKSNIFASQGRLLSVISQNLSNLISHNFK